MTYHARIVVLIDAIGQREDAAVELGQRGTGKLRGRWQTSTMTMLGLLHELKPSRSLRAGPSSAA
jgi:hypothetical protein